MNLSMTNYSKSIRGTVILDNINLNFVGGKIYGLKGTNGSGKTMIMRAICGLILPTKGFVKMDEKIIGKDISFPESVGVLIENPEFINSYSGLKNLKLLASIQDIVADEAIVNAINSVGLDPLDKRKYKNILWE